MSARTGLPTRPPALSKASGKAYSTRSAAFANRRLDRPATAFCSWITTGTPQSLAAAPPGKVTKPPKPITQAILCFLITARAARTVCSRVKGSSSLRLRPLPRTPLIASVSSGMPCCGTSRSSIESRLPSQTTWWPRSRNDCATASAGKMWPPVPPAIRRNVFAPMFYPSTL